MNKALLASLTVGFAVLASGCAHEKKQTPIVMTFEVSSVDFMKVVSMKHATICNDIHSKDGDLTLISAAKAAGVRRIVYAEITKKTVSGPLGPDSGSDCLTVYGE